VNACGSYGFGDLKIFQSGLTEPLGEVTLASNRKAVKVDKGSAMLLRVDGSGPEEAQARHDSFPSAGAITSSRVAWAESRTGWME
jgi:hypothetical protein